MNSKDFALKNLREALEYIDHNDTTKKSGRFIISRREHILKKKGCNKDDIAEAHNILSGEYSHIYISYMLAEKKLDESRNHPENYSDATMKYIEASEESIDRFF